MEQHERNHIETEETIYGPDALDRLPDACAKFYGEGPYIIFSDSNIWPAVLPRMRAFFNAFPSTQLHILPGKPSPYASDSLVADIRAAIEGSTAVPIAVGSGTINDVVKRASFETGRRYIAVPTAPSVDGFTASGAAIAVKGFKTTLQCPAPQCIVADEEIVAEAPYGLIASGYGDLVAKLTGGADWIIADWLGVEPIAPAVWEMVQPVARDIIGRAEAVRRRDRTAIGILFNGLIATGLAMQTYHDSRPASGTEHLISHVWEMGHLEYEGIAVSHGFKVAMGTLISAAFMRELLAPQGRVGLVLAERHYAPVLELLERRLAIAREGLAGSPAFEQTERVIRAKTPAPGEMEKRVRRATRDWPALGAAVGAQLPAFETLRACLLAAGCPVEPADIGLSREVCLRGLRVASLIRKRYTVLDLASELGVLEETAEEALSRKYFSRFAQA
jgi:glycerol-1-phosphate dehydrogenase [NAD(P)+]